jgi:hypothetical protein
MQPIRLYKRSLRANKHGFDTDLMALAEARCEIGNRVAVIMSFMCAFNSSVFILYFFQSEIFRIFSERDVC